MRRLLAVVALAAALGACGSSGDHKHAGDRLPVMPIEDCPSPDSASYVLTPEAGAEGTPNERWVRGGRLVVCWEAD